MDQPVGPLEVTVSATEFKAKCLGLLDRLARHDLDRVVITKRGKIVGVLGGPPLAIAKHDDLYGCMTGTFWIDPTLDLTEPMIDMPDEAEEPASSMLG